MRKFHTCCNPDPELMKNFKGLLSSFEGIQLARKMMNELKADARYGTTFGEMMSYVARQTLRYEESAREMKKSARFASGYYSIPGELSESARVAEGMAKELREHFSGGVPIEKYLNYKIPTHFTD